MWLAERAELVAFQPKPKRTIGFSGALHSDRGSRSVRAKPVVGNDYNDSPSSGRPARGSPEKNRLSPRPASVPDL